MIKITSPGGTGAGAGPFYDPTPVQTSPVGSATTLAMNAPVRNFDLTLNDIGASYSVAFGALLSGATGLIRVQQAHAGTNAQIAFPDGVLTQGVSTTVPMPPGGLLLAYVVFDTTVYLSGGTY